MKALILSIILFLVYGCNDRVSVTPQKITSIIEITSSTTLTKDYVNTQFIIKGNDIIFNLGSHTIKNYSDTATIVVADKSSNVTIRNGQLEGNNLATGIYLISCVNENDAIQLTKLNMAYENTLYNRCSNNINIRAIKFKELRTSIYVAAYISNVNIINNVFSDNDRMAIYLDTGSKNTVIKTNIFFNNGFRAVENKGRRRGHISIDASYNNIISTNKFTDTKIKKAYVNYNSKDYLVPVIELYRNCGEKTVNWNTVLPRLHGADNNIIENNEFNTQGLGIWFKYREHDQLDSCVANYPDKSDNNIARNNTFSGTSVYDDGNNNMW